MVYPQNTTRRSAGQRGFSLIEVLVSVIILAFGLLGMVGMQAAALQSNREAKLQSTAVRYAKELAEIMRGNREVAILTNATDNPYLLTFTSGTTSTQQCYRGAASNCLICFPNACSGASGLAQSKVIARSDMDEWVTRLNNDLPGMRVAVCFDSAPYDAGGLPRWNCTNTGNVAVVKIGWTRGTTNKTLTGNNAVERAAIPSVVLPVTPGSST